MPFDPNQPFEVVEETATAAATGFDPSKPFEPLPQVASKPAPPEAQAAVAVGSTAALDKAVTKAGQVGQQQRFESQDPMVQ